MKKKDRTLKNDVIEILTKVTIVILPILLGLNFLIDATYNYEIKNSKKYILNSLSYKTKNFETTAHSLFQEIFRDMFIITNANEFKEFMQSQSSVDKIEVQKLFECYMSNKENYLQLRFIGLGGDEVIRVERINDEVLGIPAEGLQSKKERYYWWCVMSSAPLYLIPENLIRCKMI